MAIKGYLAMTAAEIANTPLLPPNIGWMACHFSPYGTGLSNIPEALPEGALLILNDRTPIHKHDPEIIARQLEDCIHRLGCHGLLLDFQRPGAEETAALAHALTQALPCPVAVSNVYAAELDCPVFLPPVPLHTPLGDHIASWQGREVWLETDLGGECITLTPEGAGFAPLSPAEISEGGYADEKLHCHYQIAVSEDQALFSLHRTAEDLDALLEEAEALGVTTTVGLYQEFFKNERPFGHGETDCHASVRTGSQ